MSERVDHLPAKPGRARPVFTPILMENHRGVEVVPPSVPELGGPAGPASNYGSGGLKS